MEHWLERAAAMQPDRVAIATPGNELTYSALLEQARRAAGALSTQGVRPGDRVALALAAGEECAAAFHGCLLIGAIAVPIDLRLTEQERSHRTGGTKTVVESLLPGAPLAESEPLDLDAVAAVMHTSGTTGAPRPVAITHGNWLASALASAVALGLDQDERWLCPMPLIHVGGLSIVVRSAIYATTAILHDRFDAEAVAAALSDPEQRITLVSLVPAMLARLLDAGLREPPTLRWALLGGGPIACTLLERAREASVPVAPTYGMTEACSQIATFGWPLPGVDVELAVDGEILVRGPTVAGGAVAPDGWLHTDDLGMLDEHGRLSIIGRKADTIITGGENVAPAEVEAVLLEHPAVADAAVHGREDPEWGEAVVATVVLRDGASADPGALRQHCAARLAAFKVPKAIGFAGELPRTASGKLVRSRL
ncbi:MAG: class I adenylate-forming enzyme family protein [Solirubrobacteraceae bacterium]